MSSTGMPMESAMRTMRWKSAATPAASTSMAGPATSWAVSRRSQRVFVTARQRFGELHQLGTESNAFRGGLAVSVDSLQVDFRTSGLRAHTEHRGVCTGSVETLVDRGDSPGDQLHLHAVDGSIVLTHHVGHTRDRQILNGCEAEPVPYRIRHQ